MVGRGKSFILLVTNNIITEWPLYNCYGTVEFSRVHHTFTPFDYFFLDNGLIPRVHSCAYRSIVISEYAPLTLDLTFLNLASSRRNWHFNISLLADDNFVSLTLIKFLSF